MAITGTTRTQLSKFDWRIEATSDLSNPTYYWYVNGLKQGEGQTNFIIISAAAGETIDVEVFDDSSTLPARAYPSRPVLGWPAYGPLTGSEDRPSQYIIELETSPDTWTEKGRMAAGPGWHRWPGPIHVNGEYRYRVVPITAQQHRGLTWMAKIRIQRRPPGALQFAVGVAAGNITIS